MRYFLVFYYWIKGSQHGYGCIFVKRDDGNFCDVIQAAKDGAKSENAVPTSVFEFQNEQDFMSAQNKEA
jgi:hypothetical protein